MKANSISGRIDPFELDRFARLYYYCPRCGEPSHDGTLRNCPHRPQAPPPSAPDRTDTTLADSVRCGSSLKAWKETLEARVKDDSTHKQSA